MSLKRKIFNIFAAVVMVFGSLPITFASTYADEPAGIVPEEENIPKSLKKVHSNNDGTYDITLEIEGVSSQKTDATKANVVVVFDSSGSMGDSAGQSTRLAVAKSAVNGLANELLSQNDPNTPGLEDVVEMSFVDFSTFIKTNTTHESPTTDYDTFSSWVDATDDNGGTNWEAALTTANNISFGDNDKTYIIFVSDGNPTYRERQYGAGYFDGDGCRSDHRQNWNTQCSVWGNGQTDPSPHRNFNAAKEIADLIVADDNKELYAVGAFGDATNMRNIGGTYYDATDQTALNAAFAEIVDKIKMGLSVADLQIEDGITPATSTEVDGTAGNFRYDVPESWGDDWTGATFEGGSVHWNPGEHKTLKNGEKASVTFTVWPSQEAMDCIAAIRNDGREACSESDLAKFGLGEKEDGSFRLITNSVATFRFRTATKNEDTGETEYSEISVPIDFTEERGPTDLPETKLEVTKLWADEMDPSQRDDIKEITLKLKVDDEEVRTFVFNKQGASADEWKNSYTYAVAPGVMKKLTAETEELRNLGRVVTVGSDEYVVLEEGHDYLFDESYTLTDDGTNHYHITKRLYHPMIIGEGGKIHDVVFSEDGKSAEIDEEMLTKLSAENTLNGGILVGKTVINNDKEDTTIEDEYEITINLSEETGVYRVYTYNPDGSVKERTDKTTYTGGTITEKIKVNQKIRIQDMPTGTTYTVTETLPAGYTRNQIDYEVVMYDGSDNKQGVNEVYGNASAQATVTNYLESGDLIIKKTVTATSGDLQKAQEKEFSFTVNFYEKAGDTNPVRTDAETCKAVKHNETCEIKNIPAGWTYEIIEAAKPGFNQGAETTKTGTIKKGDNEEEFTNDYAVTPLDPDDAKILALKAFASGYEPFWIASDQFTFVMTGNGETVESKPLTLSGDTAEFVPTITDAGTYTYTITEKTTDEDGNSLFRDGVSRLEGDEDIVVTLEVKDNGDGTLGLVSKTYSKASRTIYNIYEGDNTYGGKEGELEFTKNLQGRDWRSTDEFNFTISGSEGAPMPKETTITANKENQTVGFGRIKFTNKDVGHTYTYTVTESFDVPSVEAVGDTAEGISLTVAVSYNTETGKIDLMVSDYEDTFTNEYKTTDVTAAKVWNDDADRDGLRKNYKGYFVAVKNDEGKFVAYEALALEDKDDYAFSNLPEKNADGETINYEIVEASTCKGSGDAIECTEFTGDDDYTVTVSDGVITNEHEPALYNDDGDLTVQKIWAGEGNELARPDTITVELYGEVTNDAGEKEKWMVGEPVPISAANEWKWTFTGLLKNEGGKEITYSVEESKLGETGFDEGKSIIVMYDGDSLKGQWEKSIDGYEVTNTWTKPTEEIVFEGKAEFGIKKYDGDGKVMEGVVFTIGGDDYTTDANGEIKVTVPVDNEKKEETFEYEISEKSTREGYDLVEGTATVTVSCTSKFASADAEKLVNAYTKTCELSEDGAEAFEWNGETGTVKVVNERSLATSLVIRKETAGISGTALRNNGLKFTVTGPEDFETQEIAFDKFTKVKEGVYEYALTGKIPTGEYKVVESGAEFDGLLTLTVTGENDKAKAVEKAAEAKFTIKNTYEKIRDVHYKVAKVWEDDDDRDGARPEGLGVTLLRNGESYRTTTLAAEDWAYEWTDLPRADEDATEYVYSVVEENVAGYESDGGKMTDGVFTFTNTHEPETKELKFKKVWNVDSEVLPSVAPTFITVELSNDKNDEVQTIRLDGNGYGEWESEAVTVLVYANQGEEITYTVKETGIGEGTLGGANDDTLYVYNGELLEGKWTAENADALTVTNTWTPAEEKIEYEGEKEFVLSKVDDDGDAMEGVVFTINGEEYVTDENGQITVEVPVSADQKEESFKYEIAETDTWYGYDLVEGSATVAVSCASELSKADETTMTNTFVKNCEFAKDGDEEFVWDEANLSMTVTNNRSMAGSLTVVKLFSGIDAEKLQDLTLIVVGPEDFGVDGELTLSFANDCEISDGVAICPVEAEIPVGAYMVVEENAEVDNYTLTSYGDGEVIEVLKYDEAVIEVENQYEIIDPCLEGGCGGEEVPFEAPETGRATRVVESEGREAVVDNTFVLFVAIVVSTVTLLGATKFAKRK